ncbi:DUF4398 domain-containing protein [Chitinimonas naiadis]
MNSYLMKTILAGVFGLGLVACASTSAEPREQMAAGKAAIESAENAGAGNYAASELAQARDKLAKANNAAQAKQYIEAKRWAEEAQVDAQYAQARATAQKSTTAVEEVDKGNQVLRQEINRATTTPQ